MELPVPQAAAPAPDSPLDLYERLQVSEPGLSDLWLHQGNALRVYHESHRQHADVALELPTGSGKTLVGLLIAEWRRLALRQPVAYACVNNQLAEQVAGKAARYGIDVVLLTGKKRDWPAPDAAAFRAGDAIAVSNYHHVFNHWSGLDAARTLVFDDAHGGEDAVASTWSITISREKEPGLYASVLGILSDALSPPFASLLALTDVDPREQRVELVPPTALPRRSDRLRDALAAGIASGSHNDFALTAIGQQLERCLVYFAPREILVRPFIPPTRELHHVSHAEQRLYMSATLGAGGELERAFGVDRVHHIPADAAQQRSGRRLLLMPGLRIDEAPADEMIRSAIAATPRTAIIAPSIRALNMTAEALLDPGVARHGADEIAAFVNEEPSALLLANRYDGIDLPGDQCRLIVLSGLPAFGHSQERFLFDTVGAERVLRERIRTRIIQGAGRATRNRQDFAAVILRGEDLLRFVQRREARSEMRPELQVELELGEYYSRESDLDLLEVLAAFWEHGETWQPIERYLRDQVAARERSPDPVSQSLAAAASHEVHAWWSCWQGDLQSAVDAATAAVAQLAGEPLRAYRAVWEYFAASWAALLAADGEDPNLAAAAASLRSSAEATARMLRWFPRFEGALQTMPIGPQHDARSERTTQWIRKLNTRRRRFDETITAMRDQVASRDPSSFHRGVETLGLALGFTAWRDDGRPACPDIAWRDDNQVWILFEAKTLQHPETPLPANDVRQANSHDNWIEAEEGWKPRPDQLLTVVVSPRRELGDAADVVADPDVALIEPEAVEAIAGRVVSALAHLRGLPATLSDIELANEVSAEFTKRELATESLLATLGTRPLRASSD
jgi:Rad3-related DNA helicase